MAKVFVVGMAVVDFVFYLDDLPRNAQKYCANKAVIVGGGPGANAAVAVNRLGGQAYFGGRLGDDYLADIITGDLIHEGVDVSYVQRSKDAQSSYSSVYLDKEGERQIVNFRGSCLIDDTKWINGAPEVDAFLVDSRWVEGAETALTEARDRGIAGVLDAEEPVDETLLQIASHIAFSKQGLLSLSKSNHLETALLEIASLVPGFCCVTDGEKGTLYVVDQKVAHVPAFKVSVADSLGAGDIWHGAFALKLAEGAGVVEGMEFANAAAAIKCTRFGGRQGCPDRSETYSFIEEN